MQPSPPLKNRKIGFFSNIEIIILKSLTPSHLLKVTKFLVEISQFRFLVMREKNIFIYNFFFQI